MKKITIELPIHLLEMIDNFIIGEEVNSYSEIIRTALIRYIEEERGRLERVEIWKKLQQLQEFTKELERMRKQNSLHQH